ncbi:uncharacterized protein LOC135301060 [Passer domesticus]|uniref:uncharacterized protein LOC135301060 n=1 Tax=Passer domesticus TaxID=48849 RepID=UPI0030FE579C
MLPHLTLSTVPYQPFPVRGWGNWSCRQTSRSAPGRPPLPRPALLPPPLQRQALTAISRTRVRDCGKFQTACRALRKEEGAGAGQRERERRRYRDPRCYRLPPHLPGPHRGQGAKGAGAAEERAGRRYARVRRAGAAAGTAVNGGGRCSAGRILAASLVADGLLEFRVGVGDCALWRPFSPGKARRRSEGAASSSRPASPFLNRQGREGASFSVVCCTAVHALCLAPPYLRAGWLSQSCGG